MEDGIPSIDCWCYCYSAGDAVVVVGDVGQIVVVVVVVVAPAVVADGAVAPSSR